MQKMANDPLGNFQIAFCKTCKKLLENMPKDQTQVIKAIL